MISNVPWILDMIFFMTALATLGILYYSVASSVNSYAAKIANKVLVICISWLILQGIIAYTGFYNETLLEMPPRLPMMVLIPLVILIFLFSLKKSRSFITKIQLHHLIIIHCIRIPVEMVLYGLYISKAVPQIMTFTGRNYDILAGITAPIIAFMAMKGNLQYRKIILAWNLVSLVLLLNIVIHAVLSLPVPIQKFGFDQPNIAVLYFPFIWLPLFIVPVVLFSHLTSILILFKNRT